MSIDQPYGITIFCDDIRQEMGNKPSYMGIYTGDLIVQAEQSVVLPKLCAAVHIMIPTHQRFEKLALVLIQEKGGTTSELSRVDMEGAPLPENPVAGTFFKVHFDLVISPFVVDGPNVLKMRAYIDESAELKLGSLKIILQPPPASEPLH